jgi:hypothetical protein
MTSAIRTVGSIYAHALISRAWPALTASEVSSWLRLSSLSVDLGHGRYLINAPTPTGYALMYRGPDYAPTSGYITHPYL